MLVVLIVDASVHCIGSITFHSDTSSYSGITCGLLLAFSEGNCAGFYTNEEIWSFGPRLTSDSGDSLILFADAEAGPDNPTILHSSAARGESDRAHARLGNHGLWTADDHVKTLHDALLI